MSDGVYIVGTDAGLAVAALGIALVALAFILGVAWGLRR